MADPFFGQLAKPMPIKILDKQMFEMDTNVVFCKRCVCSNQRPRLVIDQEGICSACRYADLKDFKIDWAEREGMLVDLLARHRSPSGQYDVIVPSSGGKDSALVAHMLKTKYGMHPLTVTWAPFQYTDIGFRNYVNMVDAGFDNIMMYPDGKFHRKLARVSFELRGDHWDPFAFGQKAFAFHMAVKFGIPLIFYGENGEAEYGGSLKNGDKPFESVSDWEELYYKGAGADKLINTGLEMGVFTAEELKAKPVTMYSPPPLETIDKLGIQMHWWSFYRKWVPQENYYYAVENTGFESNPDGRSEGTYSKYTSLDDKTDGFHWYLGYIKFGMGRATRDAMMEIRSKHITREEGVALVRRYDGEFPKRYFPDFLAYLSITEEHFWEVVDAYRKPHLWEKQGSEWKLKHQVS